VKVFTHGIGGAQDLPISLPFALAGGAAALAVSFAVLVLAWRAPRFDGANGGRPLPSGVARSVDGGVLTWLLRALGLAFTAYVAWAAIAGPDTAINPTFGAVYVLLWVGLVPLSLLFGPFYRAVNPLRTLHLLLSKVTGGDPAEGVTPLPAWVGLWPAAFGIFAFTWLELVYPESGYLAPVRLWFAVYAAVVLVGAAVFGERWIAAADPFEAYSSLVGRLSFFGRRDDGTLVVRSPLQNLDGLPPVAGLLPLTGILLGSTAFDSFKESLTWLRLTTDLGVDKMLLDTLALLAFWLLVAGLFGLATLAAPAADDDHDRGELPGRFASSLVPIIVGYVIAHYLTLLVEYGQQTLIYLSDPMGTGANYLGTADLQVNYWLSRHQTLLAYTKVLSIVGGHVLGVIAAHDKAMKLLPRRHQLTGQLPLLAVMVGFTVGGLYLLLTV
jgi:hypothetical protein